MGRQHVTGDVIAVRQEKTDTPLLIPLHPDLASALSALPRTNMTFLVTERGAPFTSAGFGNWFRDPLWDTTSSQGRLLSTLLAAIAEFERELIRERTGEGRKRAMAKGVRFGRKPKLTAHQRREAIARRDGETLVEIARSYNVDQSMISRLAAH
jgi:hypothetical protein